MLIELDIVHYVRNIGAIGVIELKSYKYAKIVQDYCVKDGVWIRPFGKLVYSIVVYTITNKELHIITSSIVNSIKKINSGYEISTI